MTSPLFWIGAAIVLFWTLAAAFAPALAPFDPDLANAPLNVPLSRQPFAQGGRFWLGTDGAGRDILSSLIWGARPVTAAIILTVVVVIGIGLVTRRGRVKWRAAVRWALYVSLLFSGLGLTGLGLSTPYAEWGGMIFAAAPRLADFPHMLVSPGLAMGSLILGLYLLARRR